MSPVSARLSRPVFGWSQPLKIFWGFGERLSARLRKSAEQQALDEALNSAARRAVRPGLLLFNVPVTMTQGRRERVEVRITRSRELRDELLTGLRGTGEPQIEEIDTSLYMEVWLTGPAFGVTCHSPAEQLVIPAPARWEFDVLPYRAGHQAITLHVSMRIEAEGIVGGRRGVSVLEKRMAPSGR